MRSSSKKDSFDYKRDKGKSQLLDSLENFLSEVIEPVSITTRQDQDMEYHVKDSFQFFPSLITSSLQIAIALITVQIILKLCKTKS